ncbi:MAG: DUF4350 domain-containing protein [Candidatus Brocadiia bacterium]
MPSDFSHLKLLLVAGVILLLAVLAGALTARQERGIKSPRRSIRSTDASGIRAFYEMLASNPRYQVTSMGRMSDLFTHRGVLIIAGPLEKPPTRKETDRIISWIKKGNGLLYFVGTEKTDRPSSPLEQEMTRTTKKRMGSIPTHLLRELRLATIRGKIPAFSPAPQILQSVSTETAYPLQLKGISLYVRGLGSLVTWRKLGEGRIVTVASSVPIQNQHIEKSHNLDFLLCAVDLLKGKNNAVLFDELHHGYARKAGMAELIGVQGFAAAAIQFFICGLLYVWLQGRRMGPPVEPPKKSPGGRKEYLDAAGKLYRQNCSPGEIASAYADFVKRKIARSSQFPANPRKEQLASILAEENRQMPQNVQDLLAEASEAKWEGTDPDRATQIIRELNRLIHTEHPDKKHSNTSKYREKWHGS